MEGQADAPGDTEITVLLRAALDGEPGARDRLIDRAYHTIHEIAEHHVAREGGRSALQPTEVVHEAYVRVLGRQQPEFENRRHFFGAFSRAMQEVLVDNARRVRAVKRGGGEVPGSLHSGIAAPPRSEFHPTELERVLPLLERDDPRAAEIVRFRCVLGMSERQIAEVLGVSERTVRRDWVYACAFLRREVAGEGRTHV